MHMNTGPNAVILGPPRRAWRPQLPRILESGDLVALEVFGMRQSQHQLTVALEPVSEDIERAAKLARRSHEAGLAALKPGQRFGDGATAMTKPIEEAGGWIKGPQIHSLNPLAAICGFSVPPHFNEGKYSKIHGIPTVLAVMEIKAGMSFAFEPTCGFGRRAVTIGGTVIAGAEGAIELNPFTARLQRIST